MDYEKLKKTVRKIEMPDEMRERIIRNCQSMAACGEGEIAINKERPGGWLKKPVSVAAVAALCLCFTVAASAASHSGFFRDIVRWDGAVVGNSYENATDEIEVAAAAGEGGITVCAVMNYPATVPYSELETLGIESYKIIDSSGNVVVDGKRTELFELSGGKSKIKIPLENIGSGEYKLEIAAFVGAKKADQPLQINGKWECAFSL